MPVDRARLPGHDAEPEVTHYEMEDGPRTYLSWGMEPIDDEPEALRALGAPAGEHLRPAVDTGPDGSEEAWPTERLLQRLYEALELPGEGDDYHHALQAVQRVLSTRKLAEPDVLDVVESLAWLDIRLLVAYPRAVTKNVPAGSSVYLGGSGFGRLIQLYRSEGFLRDAVELAEFQQQHFPGSADQLLGELQGRLELIRAEAAPEP